jgi:hypothetical protein
MTKSVRKGADEEFDRGQADRDGQDDQPGRGESRGSVRRRCGHGRGGRGAPGRKDRVSRTPATKNTPDRTNRTPDHAFRPPMSRLGTIPTGCPASQMAGQPVGQGDQPERVGRHRRDCQAPQPTAPGRGRRSATPDDCRGSPSRAAGRRHKVTDRYLPFAFLPGPGRTRRAVSCVRADIMQHAQSRGRSRRWIGRGGLGIDGDSHRPGRSVVL